MAAVPPSHIVLVGMMGVGKTTIGRRVARALGMRHIDIDRRIERQAGRTIPEIFAADGEAAFRAVEAEALGALCRSRRPSVISTGGGAVLSPANREVLGRCGTVVWLRATPATILVRVRGGKGRPLLADDPAEAVRRISADRAPLYEAVSDAIVDVDDLTAEQVTALVVDSVSANRQAS